MNGPRVVICGGGLMGLSVAYNLAKRGAKGLYLFERNSIGTHNATRANTGLLASPMFYSDPSLRAVVRNSFDMYTELAADGAFKFNRCGRVYLASSDETEVQARRLYSRIITDPTSSSEAELLDCPSEMLSRWPMLATEDVKLAVFSPLDSTVDVLGLCRVLTDHCKEMGVQVFENCGVKKVLLNEENRVYAVDTDEGFIDASTFVNAAGIWSSLVEVLDNVPDHQVRIAAHPCSYTFLSTDPLPQTGLSERTPVFIAMDENIYICPTEYRTICGGFVEGDLQSLAPPTPTKGKAPEWHLPQPNWDNFRTVLRHLINRCPALAQLSRGDLITGAEMYTPDMRPVIGESDQARGYFHANGLNGQGLSYTGGLGSVLAEWIMGGQPPPGSSMNVDKLDVSRFLPLHSNPQYLFQRVPEVASNIFRTLSPSHQCHTARNLRTSPIHHHLRAAGAVFAENMGYERPLWYNPPQPEPENGEHAMPRQSLFAAQDPLVGRPSWFPLVAKEYQTCRETVGLIDMTSFAKFDIQGPDVVPLLQRLCSANIDRPVGTTSYTGMQNEAGGYVTDLTVSRMGLHSYFLVAPTVQQTRLALWIRRWAREWKMQNVQLQDVTNGFTALDLVGPASRDLMREVTGRHMEPSEFPTFAFREMHIGLAGPVRVISVTHCGELGWMLYIPNEIAQNVYEQLTEAGTAHGLRHCGYYALRHLRIEKFYVYWGQDIDSGTTPVECGRVFRVDFDKEFIGKEALQRQLERGVHRRYVQLLLDNHDPEHDPWPQGEEPIYRSGKLVGWTTTAAYGFTLGCQVCLGYVENKEFGLTAEYLSQPGRHYEVELAHKRFPCRVNLHSPNLPMVSSEHPHHYRPTQ